jgi:predicted transcriptional regulator
MFEKLQDTTDPRTLARTNGPDTSKEAAASIDTSYLEQVVLGAVMTQPDGAIQDDVLRLLAPRNYAYSSVTARFRALLDKGLIKETGEKRKGRSGRNQRVLKAVIA